MDQIKIGKFIALCRKEINLTQSELAERVGVSNRTISKWETGRGMPDLSLFKPLCECLNITYNELLNGEKNNEMTINNDYEQTIINTIEYTNHKIQTQNLKLDILYIFIVILLSYIFLTFWKTPAITYGGILTSFLFMIVSCLIPFVSFFKPNLTYLFSIISFSCCSISFLNLYHLTNHFVSIEKIAGIYDTVPASFALSKFCVIVTISINVIICLISYKRKKST